MSTAKKLRVLLTQRLTDTSMNRFHSEFDGVYIGEGEHSSKPIPDVARELEADALFVTLTEKIDSSVIDSLPESVKIITTLSVGFDHIDLKAAAARGITVTNTPEVLSDATAETAVMCLMGAARRAHEAMNMIYEGKWTGAKPTTLLGTEIHGKKLAIVGMGRIGQRTAEIMSNGFGMDVHYHNRRRLPEEVEKRINKVTYHPTLDSLLPHAQFLSLHCPATPETIGMVNDDFISKLPDGCILANTARGNVVNDDALIKALKSKKVFAAGLDVFAGEPNLNKGYLSLPNVFLLPHIGSATVETRERMADLCMDSILQVFAGEVPPNKLA